KSEAAATQVEPDSRDGDQTLAGVRVQLVAAALPPGILIAEVEPTDEAQDARIRAHARLETCAELADPAAALIVSAATNRDLAAHPQRSVSETMAAFDADH